MKTKIVLVAGVLVVLAATVAIALLLSPSVPVPPRSWALNAAQWKSQEPISVTTHAKAFGVQKGDAFSYFVDVCYEPAIVAEIDKAGLGGAVDLAPFEVRSVKESDLGDSHGMRVYRREYELQLIAGETNQWYEFPAIIARYRPQGSAGLLNVEAKAQPIYVASRLPANVDDLDMELMPIAPTVSDLTQRGLPWMLWGLGALMAGFGAANLVWCVIPQWNRMRRQSARSAGQGGPVADAYRTLAASVAAGAEPRRVLHQMDHVLRLVLVSRDGLGWLEEPDLERVPSSLRDTVTALLDRCEKAYGPVPIEQGEAQEALAQLDAVLAHYFGAQEVEAWRS